MRVKKAPYRFFQNFEVSGSKTTIAIDIGVETDRITVAQVKAALTKLNYSFRNATLSIDTVSLDDADTFQLQKFMPTILRRHADESLHEIPIFIQIHPQPKTKNDFLSELQNDLKTMQRSEILNLFKELKKPNGEFAFVHEQRNPLWDSFRLFFCGKRNDEKDFWHTKTYQTAVKMLKDAYVSKADDSAVGRSNEANALIDYVRGNAPLHRSVTSTRKNNF